MKLRVTEQYPLITSGDSQFEPNVVQYRSSRYIQNIILP
jgi:hypothetical protein